MIKRWGLKRAFGAVGVSMGLLAATALGILGIGQLTGISDGGAFSPSLAFAAPSDEIPASFDQTSAGLGAYLNLGATIDIDKIKAELSPVRGESANHVLGTVPTGDLLYAETSGWLIAYSHRDNVASKIAAWTASGVPALDGLTPGHASLAIAMAALGMDFEAAKPDIKYYHWGYPTATQAVVLVRGTIGLAATMTFEVPAKYEVFEASWSRNAYEPLLINDYRQWSLTGQIGSFTTDTSYVFNLNPSGSGRLGVAVFLLLK